MFYKMHSNCILVFVLSLSILGSSRNCSNYTCEPSDLITRISNEYSETLSSVLPSGSCDSANIAIRREWNTLSKTERLNYLGAVKCLQNKKPKTKTTLAHTRYEEFVYSHINVTLKIHYSGLLLPWHGYFLWLYEKALREECGYKGYQPYWDWSKYVANPDKSFMFDGSEYSFGGNGKAIPHGPSNLTLAGGPPPVAHLLQPAGTEGSCVVGGPFANYTLFLDATNKGASSPVRIFDKRRCLTQDFYIPTLAQQNSYQNVTDLILQSTDIHAFRTNLEAIDGVHRGGHAFIGGENNNLFTSPSDPVFFLHHGMVDRVWAIWQSRDFRNRNLALDGTLTWSNYPPSPNATIHDNLDMGPLGSRQIYDVMSTVDNILCYKYE